ncbi:MAG: hypothetical protein HY303_13420 [Candidatus Wallbacteria bacterium]|nr:hypothetical protein [Candidatus Wallbacteria bacterium]
MSTLSSWRNEESARIPVIVTYRVKAGNEAAFEALLKEHWPALKDHGLVTDRPAALMRNQTDRQLYVEVFEWNDKDSVAGAPQLPPVQELWEKMRALCESGGIQPVHYDAV